MEEDSQGAQGDEEDAAVAKSFTGEQRQSMSAKDPLKDHLARLNTTTLSFLPEATGGVV